MLQSITHFLREIVPALTQVTLTGVQGHRVGMTKIPFTLFSSLQDKKGTFQLAPFGHVHAQGGAPSSSLFCSFSSVSVGTLRYLLNFTVIK